MKEDQIIFFNLIKFLKEADDTKPFTIYWGDKDLDTRDASLTEENFGQN